MKVLRILFKQNVLLNTLNIFVFVLFFTLIFIFIVNLNQANIETKTANNFKGQNVYQVSDELTGQKETSFFKGDKGYDALSKFNHTLSQSPGLTYYNATWQPVGVAKFKGEESFDPNYQFGGEITPKYERNKKVYTFVSAVQVNKAVFELNNLQIGKGKQFAENDYMYTGNNLFIPVLLGNQYSGLYNLGSKIDIFLYNKEIKGKVIGFLNPTQKIMTDNDPELILDRYIILPSIIFDKKPSIYLKKNPKDEPFIRASLLANTDGLLLSSQSPIEIRKTTDEIAMETGFNEFQLIGADGLIINSLVAMTKANVVFVALAITALFFIALIIFLYIFHLKIRKNVNLYFVLLISGANIQHIKRYVKGEFILFALFGIVFPVIPLLILTGGAVYTLFYYLIFSIGIVLLISQVLKHYINKAFEKIDIVQHLKR